MKRLLTFLRSPRLAVVLALVIAALSIAGTLVPQADMDPAAVSAWSSRHPAMAALFRPFGLFSMFTSPPFVLAVALLAVGTVLCAWARTRAAVRTLTWERRPMPSAGALAKRRSVSEGPVRSDTDDLLASVLEAARDGGLRAERDGDVVAISRTTWGALGSPVFHWALALLVIVIALGQATRAEGRLPVPVGGRVTDSAENYSGRIERGALFSGHSGLTLSASDFEIETPVDGIDRGPSAVITLSRGTREVARGRVYPNSPLRYGSLLIHPDTWGYAPLFSVETTDGQVLTKAYGYILVSEVTSQGAGPGTLRLSGAARPVTLRFRIPAGGTGSASQVELQPRVRVSVEGATGQTPELLLDEGQRAPLFDGLWLRFVERGSFVRVAVANDWSVPWIYSLFLLAATGLSVALFLRARGAWVFAEETSDGSILHTVPRSSRSDAAFEDRLARLLVSALPSSHEEDRT